jgi:heme/copper-type cytochrome/quinol oxidase subunit 2
MQRTFLGVLASTVLVLPIWVVLSWTGALPEINASSLVELGLGTAVIIIPVIAMGVLTIWALRRIEKDQELSETQKRRWHDFVFFFAPLGATLYLYHHLPRTPRKRKDFGK